jgi:hypothetical protein
MKIDSMNLESRRVQTHGIVAWIVDLLTPRPGTGL